VNKGVRDVVKHFEKAGLEVEIVTKKKHHFIYFEGVPVYKVSISGRLPSWAVRDRAAIIRSLVEDRESRTLLR